MLHIVPSIHVGVCQLIHNHNLRMNLKDSVQIHLFNLLALVENLLARNHGQTFQHPHSKIRENSR